MMEVGLVMTRLTNILQACSLPRDPNYYKTGFWGRAQVRTYPYETLEWGHGGVFSTHICTLSQIQVVHYAMALVVCWAFSSDEVRSSLYSQKDFPQWLKRLVLEDPEPAVRREVCTGLYRLCLGVSADGKTGSSYAPELISHLLHFLHASLSIKPQQKSEVKLSNITGLVPLYSRRRSQYNISLYFLFRFKSKAMKMGRSRMARLAETTFGSLVDSWTA